MTTRDDAAELDAMPPPMRALAQKRAQGMPNGTPRARSSRARVRMGKVQSSGDAREDAVTFSGALAQDVRKGTEGFATTISVDGREHRGRARIGDVVRIAFGIETNEGDVLRDASESESVTFEVGASDVMGNPLFRAFDEAVRTIEIGETATARAHGGEYDPNLLFAVPSEHEEIRRLRNEWNDKGGFVEGLTVTLANGEPAVVRAIDSTKVVLDANHPFAGSDVLFKVTLLGVNDDADIELEGR